MFEKNWFCVVEELREEQNRLEMHSYKALQNMLGYCMARVRQLSEQQYHLKFLASRQYDLYGLLETSQRLKRAKRNYGRFEEKTLLLKLEIARREATTRGWCRKEGTL